MSADVVIVRGLDTGQVLVTLVREAQVVELTMGPDEADRFADAIKDKARSGRALAKTPQASEHSSSADVDLSANPDEKPGHRYCPHCDLEVIKSPVGQFWTGSARTQPWDWLHIGTNVAICADGFRPRYGPLYRGEQINPVSGSDLLTEHRPAPKDTP